MLLSIFNFWFIQLCNEKKSQNMRKNGDIWDKEKEKLGSTKQKLKHYIARSKIVHVQAFLEKEENSVNKSNIIKIFALVANGLQKCGIFNYCLCWKLSFLTKMLNFILSHEFPTFIKEIVLAEENKKSRQKLAKWRQWRTKTRVLRIRNWNIT